MAMHQPDRRPTRRPGRQATGSKRPFLEPTACAIRRAVGIGDLATTEASADCFLTTPAMSRGRVERVQHLEQFSIREILSSLRNIRSTWMGGGAYPVCDHGGSHGWHPRHRMRSSPPSRYPVGVVALQRGGGNLSPAGAGTGSAGIWRRASRLIMLGVSKLFEFPPPVELFNAGRAGLIVDVLVVMQPIQLGKLIPRARHVLHHWEVQV